MTDSRKRGIKIAMWLWNLIVIGSMVLALTGCMTRDIVMVKDGQQVNCGDRFYGTSPAIASRIVEQEALCVRDFKEQGFVRKP